MLIPYLIYVLSAAAPALDVEFIGNAGVSLSDGETTLLVDLPYQSGAYGYMPYDFSSLQPEGRAVALITHGHADHFLPELFKERDWEFLGPEELSSEMDDAKVIPLTHEVSVGAFTVYPTRTPHARVEHYSYLVTWHGRRLYFVGDVEDPTQVLAQENLDVAFVTPWLSCLVFDEGAKIDAERLVLYHHFENKREPTCGEPARMTRGEVFRLHPADP